MEESKSFQYVNKRGLRFWKDSINLEFIPINHSHHEDFMSEEDDDVITCKKNIWEEVSQQCGSIALRADAHL